MKKNIAHETCKKILQDYEYSGTWLETKADEAEDLLNSSKRAFQNLSFKKSCTICQPVPGCSCCQRYCGFCQNPRTITCNISCRTQESGRFDFYTIAYSFARVLANYLDLTKDTALLMEMMLVVQAGLFLKFGTFPSAIAWILVASIVLPLLFSAVETAKNRPTIILGSNVWQSFEENPPSRCKIWLLRILIIVFYPAIPAINICAREAAKAKKGKLLEKTKKEFSKEDSTIHREVLERLAQLEKYLVEVRKGIMTFKLNELSWEMPLQIGLQLIMLLLSTSFTITHAGMQALFQEDFKVSLTGDLCIGCPITCHSIGCSFFFQGEPSLTDLNPAQTLVLLSVIWSFRTCSTTYVKIKQEEKVHFMPFTTKVVLGARGLLVCLVRILCGVSFFAPFLGLGNCLAHWVAEGKSLSPEMIRNLNSTDAYWDSATVSAIYRSDYTDPENPIPVPYTAYTILPLRAAFALFVGFFAFQSLLVLSIKRKLSPHFKSAKWTSRLQHLMMANVFPDSFKDWEIDGDDEMGKNVEDYKKARCAVTKEVLSMILVQLTTNMALLTPIFMISKKDTCSKNTFQSILSWKSARKTQHLAQNNWGLARGNDRP